MTKHSAPPVLYPIGRSPVQFWFFFGLWLSGLGLLVIWFVGTSRMDWRMAFACAVVLAAGLLLYNTWCDAPQGRIGWDGEIWRWQGVESGSEGFEQSLSVIADFQKRLVLMLESEKGVRVWVCAERMECPERWLDFRRAIFCPGKAPSITLGRKKPARDRVMAVAVSGHAQAQHSIQTGP